MHNNMFVKHVFVILVIFYSPINTLNSSYNNWEQLINEIKLYDVNDFIRNSKYLESISKSANVSQECQNSITHSIKAFNNLEDWAFQMINSWGQFPPSGILSGTLTDFGDYDQCLSITPNPVIGESQHCLVHISLPLPKPMNRHQNLYHKIDVLPDFMNKSENNVFVKLSNDATFFYWYYLRLGICVPKKCTKTDLEIIAKSELNNFGLILKSIDCDYKSAVKLDLIQVFAILFLSSFLLMTVFVTFYGQFSPIKNTKLSQIIEAFSLRNNIIKLMSTNCDQKLKCINGIRVLAMIWVIIGHTMEWADWTLYRHFFGAKDILSSPLKQVVFKGHYSVETFFFLSGLLTIYICLEYTDGKYDNFNTIGFLISRFIRLIPQVAIFILLTSLIPLLSSGPLWTQYISNEVNNCYNNWWKNILCLQNFIDTETMCATQTWYVAVDMQLHWISLIVIIALLINKKFGYIFNILIIILFFILSSIMIYVNDFPPGLVITTRSNFKAGGTEWAQFVTKFFFRPWSHGSVYFIGIAFGYFVHNIRPKVLSNMQKLLIWIFLIIGYLITIYDTLYWIKGEPYNLLVSAFFFPSIRIIWAINTSTLIWMCITGNGGFINKFFTWKAFIPLSRLTYSVYLTHAWIVWIYWGSKRDLQDMNNFTILLLFCGVILMSYIIGALFSLLFESPIFVFLKYLKNIFMVKEKNNNILITSTDLTEMQKLQN